VLDSFLICRSTWISNVEVVIGIESDAVLDELNFGVEALGRCCGSHLSALCLWELDCVPLTSIR
jgi:hypothetical protein